MCVCVQTPRRRNRGAASARTTGRNAIVQGNTAKLITTHERRAAKQRCMLTLVYIFYVSSMKSRPYMIIFNIEIYLHTHTHCLCPKGARLRYDIPPLPRKLFVKNQFAICNIFAESLQSLLKIAFTLNATQKKTASLGKDASIASPNPSSRTEILHVTCIARSAPRGCREQRCKKSVPATAMRQATCCAMRTELPEESDVLRECSLRSGFARVQLMYQL